MVQTEPENKTMPAQYIILQSHSADKKVLHQTFGLYEEEEEAYAAALVRQMQSIEESSKHWPKSVIDDHWQTIHTLCKHMKETLTSFKERFTHLQTLALFSVHCPVSYSVVALQVAEDHVLNESLFRTKTRNFMDAFQPSKTDDEVDLANSEEEEDEEDEFSEEDDDEEEDIENTEGEEEEDESEDEEEDEDHPPLEDSENPDSENPDSENPIEEDSENPLLEEDEIEQPLEEQGEHTIPETEEEDQIHDEQSDEEGSGNEEHNSRGIKRSRSLLDDEEEDEIDEDELDEDEPIPRKRKTEED